MICKIIRVNQFRSNIIIYTRLEYVTASPQPIHCVQAAYSCLQLNYDLPRAASLDRSVNCDPIFYEQTACVAELAATGTWRVEQVGEGTPASWRQMWQNDEERGHRGESSQGTIAVYAS